MDRNDYNIRLNPQRYEQHLSPFGKKVLHVLIKQWDKARNQKQNESQYRQIPNNYNKVLTFNHETTVNPIPYTLPIPQTPYKQTYNEEEYFNLNVMDNIQPDIPTHEELIKGVPKKNDGVDFLHPTIAANEKLVHNTYNCHSDDENTNENNLNNNTNKSSDINWDDMLDSELFRDMISNQAGSTEGNDNLETFDITFPKQNVNITKHMNLGTDDGSTGNKRKNKKATTSKTKKVRTDVSELENKIEPVEPAKEGNRMITPKPKNNFRKQNYTKTVKNWLDNVDPHNPVDGIHDGNIDKIENNGREEGTDKVMPETGKVEKYDRKASFSINIDTSTEINIEKTLKSAKKVVQARLANKNGVMKYSKPDGDNVKIKKDTEIQDIKLKDGIKEKKVKKFVAPIKSQIPVKDITYEISAVNDSNIENYEYALRDIKGSEIIAVLLYSNGFCQLNSHHTDDACAPHSIIINNDGMFYCFKGAGQKLQETLKHLVENNKVICFGAPGVLIHLAACLQMEIISVNMYDAKIGASLLDPDNPPENFTDVQKLLSFTPLYTIATECTLQKTAWYMTLLKDCWAKLYGMLVEDALWKVFVEIEMKLVPVIADMERRGLAIDLSKLKSMEEVLLTRMKQVEQQCYKAAGKTFQINSAVQVRAILYDELQLDTKCNIKIRETICKGAKSTSETMLRSLMAEHPLPKLILEYRHLHKAHATFLTGIAQHVKDGVVRPTWTQTATATGRITSINPNLQAIPKAPFSLVLFPEVGDNEVSEHLMFRSVYVSREGHTFLAADFKHVECRVFAHAAADTELLHALSASEDLFKVLAAKWLNKPESEVVVEERERTKRLVYASLYGAGTRKLMEILDVNFQQALQVAASFNRTFPCLKSFGRGVVWRCSQLGRLATLCGRMRRFKDIASEHFALKSHAERQAVNFIVQGSAADLCKIAMILTEERLRSSSPPVDAHLVLQIHDELVWEVKDQDVDRAVGIIKEVMESCGLQCGMAVPLPVATSVGKSWGHMHEYNVITQ